MVADDDTSNLFPRYQSVGNREGLRLNPAFGALVGVCLIALGSEDCALWRGRPKVVYSCRVGARRRTDEGAHCGPRIPVSHKSDGRAVSFAERRHAATPSNFG